MASLTIRPPLIITPRLLPGAVVGPVTISITYSDRPGDGGRTRYFYALDAAPDYLPEGMDTPPSLEGDDLQSGAMGGSLADGLSSLLSFLSAAGEAHDYNMRAGYARTEPSGFPVWVDVWASECSDELEALAMELDDTPDTIVEG